MTVDEIIEEAVYRGYSNPDPNKSDSWQHWIQQYYVQTFFSTKVQSIGNFHFWNNETGKRQNVAKNFRNVAKIRSWSPSLEAFFCVLEEKYKESTKSMGLVDYQVFSNEQFRVMEDVFSNEEKAIWAVYLASQWMRTPESLEYFVLINGMSLTDEPLAERIMINLINRFAKVLFSQRWIFLYDSRFNLPLATAPYFSEPKFTKTTQLILPPGVRVANTDYTTLPLTSKSPFYFPIHNKMLLIALPQERQLASLYESNGILSYRADGPDAEVLLGGITEKGQSWQFLDESFMKRTLIMLRGTKSSDTISITITDTSVSVMPNSQTVQEGEFVFELYDFFSQQVHLINQLAGHSFFCRTPSR